MKKGSGTCDDLRDGRPMSMLHLQGRYMPGETAEQWRGEGFCEVTPLNEILDQLPNYTVTAMVSSKRMEKEKKKIPEGVSGVRSSLAGSGKECVVVFVVIVCTQFIVLTLKKSIGTPGHGK
jgi:hypothetical protein